MHISESALRYFVTVARELHFARAAAELHISSPSLSQQIKRLERIVGRELFERSPQAVRLTEAGEELLPIARDAVAAHDAVVAWASRGSAAPPVLRVGIVASGAGQLTSEILTTIVERHPDLRLQLVRLGFFDAASALHDDSVDVAITLSPFPEVAGLMSRSLVTESRVLVLRADHPLAAQTTVTIDQTNDLDFVVPSDATGEARDWWLVDPRSDSSRPRISAVADDVEGLLELCVAGLGVNIATRSVSSHFGRPELAYLDITDIEPAAVLLARRNEPRHPAVLAFEAIAVEAASRAEATPD